MLIRSEWLMMNIHTLSGWHTRTHTLTHRRSWALSGSALSYNKSSETDQPLYLWLIRMRAPHHISPHVWTAILLGNSQVSRCLYIFMLGPISVRLRCPPSVLDSGLLILIPESTSEPGDDEIARAVVCHLLPLVPGTMKTNYYIWCNVCTSVLYH